MMMKIPALCTATYGNYNISEKKRKQIDRSSRLVWHPSSLMCVYWEHKWRDSRDRRNSRCSCLQGGFQCDRQENASIRSSPRLFTPALILLLAPAACVCVCVCVCVWWFGVVRCECVRRVGEGATWCMLLCTSRGWLARCNLCARQRSGCPLLLWTSRKQPDGIMSQIWKVRSKFQSQHPAFLISPPNNTGLIFPHADHFLEAEPSQKPIKSMFWSLLGRLRLKRLVRWNILFHVAFQGCFVGWQEGRPPRRKSCTVCYIKKTKKVKNKNRLVPKRNLKNTLLRKAQIGSYIKLHNAEANRLVLQRELCLSHQARGLRAALPNCEQVQTNIQSTAAPWEARSIWQPT